MPMFFIVLALILILNVNSFKPFLYQKRNNVHVLKVLNVDGDAVKLSLSQQFQLNDFLNGLQGNNNVGGVYVLESDDGKSYFVGSSQNIVTSINIMLSLNPNIQNNAKSVRVQTFSVYNEDAVEAYKQELIRITNPPENVNPTTPLMTSSSINTSTSSSSGKSKLDMLKQAVKTNIANTPTKAVSNPVIEYQEVVSPFEKSTTTTPPPTAPITTPETPDMPEIKLATCENTLDFTADNVNKVLDEVRPYLQADGGNVAVVSIDKVTRGVKLLLQGACGSCPSSTTTMKMGIERVLKENFVNLGPVESISAEELGPEELAKLNTFTEELTMAKVEEALANLLKAIKGLGGKIRLLSVNESKIGEVRIGFTGPDRLKAGLELVLKDLPAVKSIAWEPYQEETTTTAVESNTTTNNNSSSSSNNSNMNQ